MRGVRSYEKPEIAITVFAQTDVIVMSEFSGTGQYGDNWND